MTTAGSALLVALGGGGASEEVISQAARAGGLDPYRLCLMLRGHGPLALGLGDSVTLGATAQALSQAGVLCAVVSANPAQSLAHAQVAGGVAKDSDGIRLRVHGRPFGPPSGVPLLFLFGDVGPNQEPLTVSRLGPEDTLQQRILRASCPVVAVIWREGRVLIPARSMSWRELPDAALSPPANLAHLLALLAEQSSGVTMDLGFVGQDAGLVRADTADEPLEGADRPRLALFHQYSILAATAWQNGLYPPSSKGSGMSATRETLAPGHSLANSPGVASFPTAAPGGTPIRWDNQSRIFRLRFGLVSGLILGPLVAAFSGSGEAAVALAVCGAAVLVFSLAGLRLREQVRAVPQSRIRSLAMGRVEVCGRVVPGHRLISPYSHVVCGWYRFEFQSRTGDGQGLYETLSCGNSGELPFRLDDGTGSVVIRPAGAEVDVEPEVTSLGDGDRALEWLLPEGNTFFVLGVAQRSAAVEEGPAGASQADSIFVGSSPGAPFLISTASRAREVQRLTWQFAGGAALGTIYLALALAILLS